MVLIREAGVMEVNDSAGTDFSQRLSDKYNHLTKSEKQIANYLRKNQDEAAFLSAAELANILDLSEATIVRFARTVGFESYPAMRAILQENFRSRVTHSTRLRSRLDDLREAGDLFEKVTISEIDYLTQSLQTVDRNQLKRAVAYILERDHIYIFGTGPSVSLVHLLNLRLTRFGKQIIPLTTTGRETLEPLPLMTADDLLFAIGFFDVNPTLQIVLDHANDTKCPVILLTDTLGSIIGEKAEVILAAKRGPVSAFHSPIVPMNIINTLLLEIANQNQEAAVSNLDKLDQLRIRLKRSGEN
jgi:DNA-binding MurR/RpiR family transcriptional regulator